MLLHDHLGSTVTLLYRQFFFVSCKTKVIWVTIGTKYICMSRCSQRPVVESLFKIRHLHAKTQLGKTNLLHDTCIRVHFDRLYQRKCLKTFFTTIVNMLVELSFKKANAICQTLVDKWTRLCMTILCWNLCTPYFQYLSCFCFIQGSIVVNVDATDLFDSYEDTDFDGRWDLKKINGLQSKHFFHVPLPFDKL